MCVVFVWGVSCSCGGSSCRLLRRPGIRVRVLCVKSSMLAAESTRSQGCRNREKGGKKTKEGGRATVGFVKVRNKHTKKKGRQRSSSSTPFLSGTKRIGQKRKTRREREREKNDVHASRSFRFTHASSLSENEGKEKVESKRMTDVG